jgi:hypothetical protein
MFKFAYIVYGLVVLVASTVANLGAAGSATNTSSGWNSHSSGVFWGGSGGSTGGFSSGGGHK